MGKARRKTIDKLATEIGMLRVTAKDIKFQLEAIREEKRKYYSHLTESSQNGDKGGAVLAAIEKLDAAIDALGGFDSIDLDMG